MGCSRKVELLVSELFRRYEENSEVQFGFGASFIQCNMAAKRIYLSKKRKLTDFQAPPTVSNVTTHPSTASAPQAV